MTTEPRASSPPPGAEPPPRRPSPAALRPTLAALLAYRGPTADGLPLSAWGIVLFSVWLLAWAFEGFELFWMMVPPVLTASIGFAVASDAGAWARRAINRRPSLLWLEPVVVMALFAALTFGVFGRVIQLRVPIDSGDHHMMIGRAQLLMEGMAKGKIAHWSHLFQGGDSLVDLYPVLLNVLTALVHFAAPKGTSFVWTYSAICLFGWWLRGVAVYNLGRRFAGPLPAMAIGVASLFEVGTEVFDGVWHGVLSWGMIHNNIAISIGLLAVALQIDLCRRVTTGRVVGCALAFAITCIAHPLGMLYAVVATAALVAGALVARGGRVRAGWAVACTVVGFFLAGIWLLPYTYALKHFSFNGSLPGLDYTTLGKGFFDGTAPVTSFAAFAGFGMVAVVASMTQRRIPLVAAGITCTLLFMLALTPFMVQAHIFQYFPSFLDAQQRRTLTVLKTAIVPCLAWLLGHAFAHVRQQSLAPGPVVARALLIGLLLFGPGRVFRRGAGYLLDDLRAQVPVAGPGRRTDGSNTNANHQAVFDWLKKQRQADPSATPWRVSLLDRMNTTSHAHWVWSEGVETGVPVVDFGWVSANFLAFRPREFSPQGFTDWNIRYATGITATPPFPEMVERFKAGPYRVWEFTGYDDRFVVAPPGVQITNLKLDGDVIEFTVAGSPPGGADLTVRSAYYPRWQATLDGRSVPVTQGPPHPGALPRQDQLALHVTDGVVRLSCDAAPPRFWAGCLVTLLGAAALAAIARARQRTRLQLLVLERLRAGVAWARGRAASLSLGPLARWRGLIGLGVLALLAGLLFLKGGTSLAFPPIEGNGLAVYAVKGQTRTPCHTAFLMGAYVCDVGEKKEAVLVEPTLGHTPVNDGAGEYSKQWPGTRVVLAEAGTSAELVFSRMATQNGVVEITAATTGKLKLSVSAGGFTSPPQTLQGYAGVRRFELPPGLPNRGDLTLKIEAEKGTGELIFKGRLAPR
jgi:hypothetical protein